MPGSYSQWNPLDPNSKPVSSLKFFANNPDRPADWLWRRALGIVTGDQPPVARSESRNESGREISKLVRYIHKRMRVQSMREEYELSVSESDMYWAHSLYSDPDNLIRHSIEAHILAGTHDYGIAARVNFAPTVISQYAKIFFDVRDRLSCKHWIVHSVLGVSVQQGVSERQYDLLWKLYGLMMGSAAVDAMELKFVNPQRPASIDTAATAIDDDAIQTLKLKAAVAAKSIAAGPLTAAMLLDRYTRFVEIERTSDSAGSSNNSILQELASLFMSLPFRVGRDTRIEAARSKSAMADRNLAPFESGAVELGWKQTLEAAAGKDITSRGLGVTLTGAEFPDKPKTGN